MSFAYIDFVRLCRISTTLSAAHKFRLFSNNIVNDVDVDVNGITLVEHSTFFTFNKKKLVWNQIRSMIILKLFLLYLCACMFERMYVCVQSISQDCKLISIGIMTKHIERYILASIHCLFFFSRLYFQPKHLSTEIFKIILNTHYDYFSVPLSLCPSLPHISLTHSLSLWMCVHVFCFRSFLVWAFCCVVFVFAHQ